jgi:hypothetical protein
MSNFDLTDIGFVLEDEKRYPDGTVVKLPPVHNVIQVAGMGALIGKLTSGKDLTFGLKYIEVGSGNAVWDATPPPPAPSSSETGLLAPISRVLFSGADWAYLVPNTSTVSGSPTRRIQLSVIIATGVGNGNLREVALYGGALATATLATGDLSSVIRHVVIAKPSGTGDFNLSRTLTIQYGS